MHASNVTRTSKYTRKRATDFIPSAVSILAAIIAALAGFYGARMGAHAAVSSQELQIRASESERVQEQRANVYSRYLDAAQAFFWASVAVRSDIDQGSIAKRHGTFAASRGLVRDMEEFVTKRNEFQGAINDVYVYGSDAAWLAHQRLAATLPPSLGTRSLHIPSAAELDQDRFAGAYSSFLAVLCQEAVPTPRQGCGR